MTNQDVQKSESSSLCNSAVSKADITILHQDLAEQTRLTNKLKQENLLYLEGERQKIYNKLKQENDTEISNIKNEYNKYIDDNNKKVYNLKQKLEDQYQSNVSAMEVKKDKEIVKLSSKIKGYKKVIEALKESNKASLRKNDQLENKCRQLENKCLQLEDVVFAKDQKIISISNKVASYNPQANRDGTIEPESYFSTYEKELWNTYYYKAINDLEVRKKYTFQNKLKQSWYD